MTNWYPVIGLEVHIQLKTKSKLFSNSGTRYGAKANSQADYVDIAMPGTLPVLNQEAVKKAIIFGYACNAKVNQEISFDRKNYFYPDLPKGYQITQHYNPILWGGEIHITREDKTTQKIRIHHTHLEEDAGKSAHDYASNMTGIDLNRAGIPLLEIVSEPDIRTAEDAVRFLKTIHNLIVYLDICDGNMQEGSMRCDANISLRKNPEDPFGTRVEVKNINSFKFVEKAINHEIKRQAEILNHGGTIKQQTRLYDESSQTTKLMREKEQAHDYRYFPEPDIPHIYINESIIKEIQKDLPELPHNKKNRYISDYNLSDYDAKIISHDKSYAFYFEHVISNKQISAKTVANWILGPIAAAINKTNATLDQSKLTPEKLTLLLARIEDGTISNNIAKNIFEELWVTDKTADEIIETKGLKLISNPKDIQKIVDQVLSQYTEQVTAYKSGNEKILGFLVGKAMQESKGKVNPTKLNEILLKTLKG